MVNYLDSARVTLCPHLCPCPHRVSLLLIISGDIGCLKAEMQKYILKLSLERYLEEILVPYTPKPALPTNLTEQFPWINFS